MITGGVFHHLQRVKTGDYEHKESRAEISFSVPDGATHDEALELADRAQTEAVVRVHAMLRTQVKLASDPQIHHAGIQILHNPAVSVSSKATLSDKEALARAITGDNTNGVTDSDKPKPQSRRGRPPNLPTTTQDVPAATVTPPVVPVDPMADTVTPTPTPVVETAAPDPMADMTGDDLFSAEPVEITDKDLTDQVTKRNSEIQNPPAIRKLIGVYVTAAPGTLGKLADIPQAKRAAFLKELAALPKVA